jgi:glutathione S-transferase
MLTLYFAPGSSSFAVHIALHETGVAFESRPLSFKNKDMKSPAYLAINPEGKVPTLVIDGRPLTEVAGILFYLAQAYPDAKLLADDAEGQARAVSWMSFIASTLHPARAKGMEHTKNVYGIADKRLGDREWVQGSYSIADIHLFRLYWRFSRALDLPAGTFPNLSAHQERMLKRDAVKKTIAIESAIGYELPAWFPATGKTTD